MSGAYTVNSIVINKEIGELFRIVNHMPNWPILHSYEKAELLEKRKLVDGKVLITFQLTASPDEDDDDDDPTTWVSHRTVDPKTYSARGIRLKPLYPFTHWVLDVLLEEVENGTKMTWVQDCAIDPKTGHTNEELEEHLNECSLPELEHFKEVIESGKVKDMLPEGFFE